MNGHTQTLKTSRKKAAADIAASYNQAKEFNGQRYTGMKVGRSHKWYYDKGEWKEKKITPDEWHLEYAAKKRRAGKAPEGSGVPVGTEYHWYILADQTVKKLNANDYATAMVGVKFKVAHKRADKDKWSATQGTQRKHVIKILRAMIDRLEKEAVEESNNIPEAVDTTRNGRSSTRRRAREKQTATV